MSVDRSSLARSFEKEFGAPPRFFSRAPGTSSQRTGGPWP